MNAKFGAQPHLSGKNVNALCVRQSRAILQHQYSPHNVSVRAEAGALLLTRRLKGAPILESFSKLHPT